MGNKMFKSYLRMPLIAVLAVTATTCIASAEGYDTSSIKVEEALAARLPEKIKSAGVLTIGSDTAYAPWAGSWV
jgi:polar amino acid transport system substrate-binding protein